MRYKELSEVAERAKTAVDNSSTQQDRSVPHLRLELQQVMSRVRPDDLSAAEIVALLAILSPADRRVIGGPTGRPRLRVLGIRGEHPAPKLV